MPTDRDYQIIEIDDDSGILGLANISDYESFVSPNWDKSNQLWKHFQEQTNAQNLLVWSCGDGGDLYRIKVSEGFSDTNGYRESTGTLFPKDGIIHIVSYTALTMAAQFEDYTVPTDTEKDYVFRTEKTPQKVRVIQMYDPRSVDYDKFPEFHFLIEYESGQADSWDGMNWDNIAAVDEPDILKPKGSLLSRIFKKRHT